MKSDIPIVAVQPDIFDRGGPLVDEMVRSGDLLASTIGAFSGAFDARDGVDSLAQLALINGHLSQLALMAAVLSTQIRREVDGGSRR